MHPLPSPLVLSLLSPPSSPRGLVRGLGLVGLVFCLITYAGEDVEVLFVPPSLSTQRPH